MTRILSGIQPSGQIHLGNYLGAIKNWVEEQETAESFYTVVDLHAITVEHIPEALRRSTQDLVMGLFALGLDQSKSKTFLQSHVAQHCQLSWLMECTVTFGELNRMTQFKDKGKGDEKVRAGLFTYPALMVADILLYQADKVPVGDDQKQHLELARTAAQRFNNAYGEVFVVPKPMIPSIGARVMDLQDPTRKMSKSSASDAGLIYVFEEPESIQKKLRKAVTDAEGRVEYEPNIPERAGVNNLLEIYSAIDGRSPTEIASEYTSYGSLKSDLSEVVISHLAPFRKRYNEYLSDPSELGRQLKIGSDAAQEVAQKTLESAMSAIGFLKPIA